MSSSRPTILVIDDDSAIRRSLEFVLSPHYDVVLANGTDRGIAALRDSTMAVILDIKMPDKDGFTAYQELRNRDEDVPIIFYSAYQDLKKPLEIMKTYRPFGYIVKGQDISTILRLIARAVDQRTRSNRIRQLLSELDVVRSRIAGPTNRGVDG